MNRKLLRSVREYKRQSFLTPVLVALEVLMEVLIPLLMANIIDIGIMQGDMGYIVKTGALLVVMAMLALFFGAKAGQLAAIASAGYAKNLRHDIFYKIQACHQADDGHHERADGIYVYNPYACESADHDRSVIDYDSDDQCSDRDHDADFDPGAGRRADLYREKSTSAFYQGIR